MKISVIGTGYLGATHAVCLAELGYEVHGVDVNPRIISTLAAGEVPIYEPGLRDLLQRGLSSGRLRFSTDIHSAADAHVHFLCVGTPQTVGSRELDTSAVDSAVRGLVPHLRGEHVIIGKSTVPVGTARHLQRVADDAASEATSVEVCWSPEFVREGHAVDDSLAPDRIVLGVEHPDSAAPALLRRIYSRALGEGTPLIVTDLATAELVKTAANSLLATKVSFINGVAQLCDATGADISTVATALGLDKRIGPHFLAAGLGFGGGCLPKDLRGFATTARQHGAERLGEMLDAVDAINTSLTTRAVDLVRHACAGDLNGRRIAVLGGAFKPGSDDVRESPALAAATALAAHGAVVTVCDPRALRNAQVAAPQLRYADSPEQASDEADCVMLATEWPQYRDLDPVLLRRHVRRAVLVDARVALDPHPWAAAGWSVYALGRPEVHPAGS